MLPFCTYPELTPACARTVTPTATLTPTLTLTFTPSVSPTATENAMLLTQTALQAIIDAQATVILKLTESTTEISPEATSEPLPTLEPPVTPTIIPSDTATIPPPTFTLTFTPTATETPTATMTPSITISPTMTLITPAAVPPTASNTPRPEREEYVNIVWDERSIVIQNVNEFDIDVSSLRLQIRGTTQALLPGDWVPLNPNILLQSMGANSCLIGFTENGTGDYPELGEILATLEVECNPNPAFIGIVPNKTVWNDLSGFDVVYENHVTKRCIISECVAPLTGGIPVNEVPTLTPKPPRTIFARWTSAKGGNSVIVFQNTDSVPVDIGDLTISSAAGVWSPQFTNQSVLESFQASSCLTSYSTYQLGQSLQICKSNCNKKESSSAAR